MKKFLEMKNLLLALVAVFAGCASYSGGGLVPGESSEAEVEAKMGPSIDRREMVNGEIVRYYSRLPSGREMYAARFRRDGKLLAIEQRLTREFVNTLAPGKSTAHDVRDLLGPPYQVQHYSRTNVEVWLYPMRDFVTPLTLNVELSDGRVREIAYYDTPAPD